MASFCSAFAINCDSTSFSKHFFNKTLLSFKTSVPLVKTNPLNKSIEVPKNMTKAIGIKKLLSELNIPLENTYAIGDSGNDIAMFKLVENPICMGNGTPQAKMAAKYVTESIDDNGLENALDRIIKGEW